MRLLIGGSPSKIFHLNEFSIALQNHRIKTKLVTDSEIYDGFPSRKIKNWFQSTQKFDKLIREFSPDAVLIDRPRYFALAVIKSKLPLLFHLRGDPWRETQWAKETTHKRFPKSLIIKKWEEIRKQCFENSALIMPICKFLETETKKHYPNKNTTVMYQGINPDNWFEQKGMKLKHPCVGLIQGAVIYGKVKEMLLLKNILKKFPNVTFYWVGDGPYRKMVLDELGKFSNFKWLGHLEYPQRIREFLTEIDIYALISGMDMSPLTLQEAQLMKKPVIATNVGGIPELMINNKTGYLVQKGNSSDLEEKIRSLLNDESIRNEMGKNGNNFVKDNFCWDKISEKFANDIKKNLQLN